MGMDGIQALEYWDLRCRTGGAIWWPQLIYTERVGGSSPSSPTISPCFAPYFDAVGPPPLLCAASAARAWARMKAWIWRI